MGQLTFDLEKNQTLVFNMLNELHDYAMELINGEFKDIFKDHPVEFRRTSTLRLYHQHILKPVGRLTKRMLRDKAKEFMFRYENCTFLAGHAAYVVDNKIKVCDLSIEIVVEQFFYHVLQNIEHIDLLMESYHQSIRHEIGHLIDYINCEGMNVDEYRALKKSDREGFVKFRDKYQDSVKTFEDENKRMHAYYEMPAEARANKNVNLDPEDIIEMDNRLYYHDKDFKMKLTINSDVEILESKEEEKKDAD